MSKKAVQITDQFGLMKLTCSEFIQPALPYVRAAEMGPYMAVMPFMSTSSSQ